MNLYINITILTNVINHNRFIFIYINICSSLHITRENNLVYKHYPTHRVASNSRYQFITGLMFLKLRSYENVRGIPNGIFSPQFPVTVEHHEDFKWVLFVYFVNNSWTLLKTLVL